MFLLLKKRSKFAGELKVYFRESRIDGNISMCVVEGFNGFCFIKKDSVPGVQEKYRVFSFFQLYKVLRSLLSYDTIKSTNTLVLNLNWFYFLTVEILVCASAQ